MEMEMEKREGRCLGSSGSEMASRLPLVTPRALEDVELLLGAAGCLRGALEEKGEHLEERDMEEERSRGGGADEGLSARRPALLGRVAGI